MERSVTPSPGPRSPGRPREFDLDDALDKAIGTFSENGYHATSLGKLTAAMEIAEGSLYKAFRDKRGVFLAAFERYVMLRSERLAQELANTRTGRDKVRAILAVYAEYSHGKIGRRGCFVVGSAVDLASSDPEMAKRQVDMARANSSSLIGVDPINPRVVMGVSPIRDNSSEIFCARFAVEPPPNVTNTVFAGTPRVTASRVIMYCGPAKSVRSLSAEYGKSLVTLPSIATSEWHCARPRS